MLGNFGITSGASPLWLQLFTRNGAIRRTLQGAGLRMPGLRLKVTRKAPGDGRKPPSILHGSPSRKWLMNLAHWPVWSRCKRVPIKKRGSRRYEHRMGVDNV